MNESRQQQFYSLVHSYASTEQNCECDGVRWSCLNFRSLSWWLSVWDSLLPVVLPSLNVKNACCNWRVCERSQTVIVAMSACTYAYMMVVGACRLHGHCDSITIANGTWDTFCLGFLRKEKQCCQKLLVTYSCFGKRVERQQA